MKKSLYCLLLLLLLFLFLKSGRAQGLFGTVNMDFSAEEVALLMISSAVIERGDNLEGEGEWSTDRLPVLTGVSWSSLPLPARTLIFSPLAVSIAICKPSNLALVGDAGCGVAMAATCAAGGCRGDGVLTALTLLPMLLSRSGVEEKEEEEGEEGEGVLMERERALPRLLRLLL